MAMQKAKIGSCMYDVVSFEEYAENPDACDKFTAVNGDDGTLYPVRNKTDNRPGVYNMGFFHEFKEPSEEEAPVYSDSHIINFSDSKTIQEIMSKQNRLLNEERIVLTTIDNVFVPALDQNDTAEMRAFKEAVIAKGIDLDKYETRFGPNFNNDRRLFARPTITMGKLKSFADKLDMQITMTISDKSPDVPNPIGKSITVDLIGGDGSESSD